MNKISSKLMMLFVFVGVTPLIVSSFYNVSTTIMTMRTSMQGTLNAIVDYKVTQIDDYLEYLHGQVQVVARSTSVKDNLIRLTDAFGSDDKSGAYNELDNSLRVYLDQTIDDKKFSDIYLVSGDGDVIFSMQHKSDFGANLLDEPHVSGPLADAFNLSTMMFGTKFVGFQPYQPSGDEFSAFIAVPIFEGGYSIGAFIVQLKKDVLYKIFSDYTGLHDTGEIVVAKSDPEGMLIVAPLRHENSADYRKIIQSNIKNKGISAAVSGKSGYGVTTDYRSQEVISAWRFIPKLQWGISIKIDTDEILKQGLPLIKQIAIEFIISLLVILVIALVFARQISKPLLKLLDATRQIASGNLQHRVAVDAKDEIGKLASSFNDMTEELEISREKSKAAELAKTQFLANMSHEIRTPMNGILGMAQILEQTNLDSEQRSFVETITQSGDSLLKILNDVLDLSKLDAHKVQLEHINFNLERVCQESLELLAVKTINKKVELILDYKPDCPVNFMGDPSRLRQILLNLLGNAVKFTSKGYIRLGVSCEAVNNHFSVNFEVEDTGIGISDEAMEHLFDEFTQADSSTTRKYGGTGLGLAISRNLVELMGGQIQVTSEVGSGTKFYFKLSLLPTDEPSFLPTGTLDGYRILFVDDNVENRKIYARLLEHMGADTVVLDDPTQTLQVLQSANTDSKSFDISIIDFDLSVKSGVSLGREIRDYFDHDSLKLMIFGAVGQRGDAQMVREAGFNAYASKLCGREIFQKMILAMMKSKDSNDLVTQHTILDAKQNKQIQPLNLEGVSVLVVEDILPNRVIAKKLLESFGVEVELAYDGQQAVDMYRNHGYDFIFMDCQMPVMDGYQATIEIRTIEKKKKSPKRVPIIALTANTSKDEHQKCEASGMDGIVNKPFKSEDLRSALEKWLLPALVE